MYVCERERMFQERKFHVPILWLFVILNVIYPAYYTMCMSGKGMKNIPG